MSHSSPHDSVGSRFSARLIIIRATVSTDPDYPGIDVEYIADYEHPLAMSRPRILMEKPKGEEIRVLAWEDKNKEDYTSEINFS